MPSATEYECLQNEICSIKLSLPAILYVQAKYLDQDNGTAANNWIIGAHLTEASASYFVNILKSVPNQANISHPDPNYSLPGLLAHLRRRPL